MLVLSATVCEIIKFEFNNITDSNVWPFKRRSRTLTIWTKSCRQLVLLNLHMSKRIGASMLSRLFAVHNRTFHDWWTNGQTNERTYCTLGYTVRRCWNGIENNVPVLWWVASRAFSPDGRHSRQQTINSMYLIVLFYLSNCELRTNCDTCYSPITSSIYIRIDVDTHDT